MTSVFSTRPFLLSIPLGLGLLVASAAVQAQTLDSGSGIGPSRAVSTPPDAAPINQPGAMQRAYAHPAASPTRHKATRPAGRTSSGPTPH